MFLHNSLAGTPKWLSYERKLSDGRIFVATLNLCGRPRIYGSMLFLEKEGDQKITKTFQLAGSQLNILIAQMRKFGTKIFIKFFGVVLWRHALALLLGDSFGNKKLAHKS
jgi:hypothetical protein